MTIFSGQGRMTVRIASVTMARTASVRVPRKSRSSGRKWSRVCEKRVGLSWRLRIRPSQPDPIYPRSLKHDDPSIVLDGHRIRASARLTGEPAEHVTGTGAAQYFRLVVHADVSVFHVKRINVSSGAALFKSQCHEHSF